MRTALACLLFTAACGTDVRTDDPPAVLTTWHQDVAPIVAEKCMGCHQAGGIGPFELTSYDAASENAGHRIDKIIKGEMPPFDAPEEPDCTPRRELRYRRRCTTAVGCAHAHARGASPWAHEVAVSMS